MEKETYLDKAVETDPRIDITTDFLIQRCIGDIKIAVASLFPHETTTSEELKERKKHFDKNLKPFVEGQLKVIAYSVHNYVEKLKEDNIK